MAKCKCGGDIETQDASGDTVCTSCGEVFAVRLARHRLRCVFPINHTHHLCSLPPRGGPHAVVPRVHLPCWCVQENAIVSAVEFQESGGSRSVVAFVSRHVWLSVADQRWSVPSRSSIIGKFVSATSTRPFSYSGGAYGLSRESREVGGRHTFPAFDGAVCCCVSLTAVRRGADCCGQRQEAHSGPSVSAAAQPARRGLCAPAVHVGAATQLCAGLLRVGVASLVTPTHTQMTQSPVLSGPQNHQRRGGVCVHRVPTGAVGAPAD